MKLGNSKGNNVGKKYFMRGRDDHHEPAQANREKADVFNRWFVENRQQLINFIIGKYAYDEDTFSTTYIRMCEKLLYTDLTIEDYSAYFHRSYYTNYVLLRTQEARCVPLLIEHKLEAHHDNPYERERMQWQLESDVFDYVYRRYSLQEYEIFRMYISLKPAINYHTLEKITHIKAHNIQRMVSKILADIRSNKAMAARYREIK